ncbi:MAG: glucosidase, partial [Ginsengibacter sp.]
VALEKYYQYFEEELKVELPSHSGNLANLKTVADELRNRLTGLFTADKEGKRNVNGQIKLFNTDEHFKNLISFYECFHGDSGKGVGASHQTGWTGIIAEIIRKENKN